jgi:Protein of unknown function (DUF551)
VREWINVKDKLPEQNQLVVAAKLYDWTDPDAAVCVFTNNNFVAADDALSASNYDGGAVIVLDIEPTHWMPLPEN